MTESKIVYPLTLDYVPDWKAWEIVRELASNARDLDADYRMGLEKATSTVGPKLWIRNRGVLNTRHLLLGVSEGSDSRIGEYGEGLKLAMLALTRMNLTGYVYVRKNDECYCYWNEPAELHGESVFAIHVDNECGEGLTTNSTLIEIPNWQHRLYEDRFVRAGDPRVVYVDPYGRFVLDEEVPQLYVKGVWVQEAKGYDKHYRFGYNLVDADMNRDRKAVSIWDVNYEIGKIWASCTDEDLLVRYWRAVKDGGGERGCRLSEVTKARAYHKRAVRNVFGSNVVVATDEAVAREAKHIGASVLDARDIGSYNADALKEVVGTDAEHVQALQGKSKVFIPDKKLGDTQRKVLGLLRRIGRRVGTQGKTLAYILPDGILGEQQGEDVRIALPQLADDRTALMTWLHEEAHRRTGASDTTDAMVNAVSSVAADVILSYARR